MGSGSDTEKERREHAESMIRAAVKASSALAKRDIRVFAQGSYRNNTNIPQESDVDICVECSDQTFSDTEAVANFSKPAAGLSPGTYTNAELRNDVEKALVAKFGRAAVVRGNKAFDVSETTYRVDADVVAAFEHRRYASQTDYIRPPGIQFFADDGAKVINWPEQHYSNGVAKNKSAAYRFKGVTRILKSLRFAMLDAGTAAAKPIPSYLIECLVYNALDTRFGHDRVYDDVSGVIAEVWNGTKTQAGCNDWREVNRLFYLLRGGQSWTREQAHEFLLAAWHFVGFKS